MLNSRFFFLVALVEHQTLRNVRSQTCQPNLKILLSYLTKKFWLVFLVEPWFSQNDYLRLILLCVRFFLVYFLIISLQRDQLCLLLFLKKQKLPLSVYECASPTLSFKFHATKTKNTTFFNLNCHSTFDTTEPNVSQEYLWFGLLLSFKY